MTAYEDALLSLKLLVTSTSFTILVYFRPRISYVFEIGSFERHLQTAKLANKNVDK
jgi:hypothetical protein